MASDKERREIAERMRGPFDVCECVGHTYISGTLYGMQVCAKDELELRDGMRRLADLIDPTCSMDAVDTGEQADYECREHIMHCSNCGTEFGYVLYGEDGDVSMDDKPKFCPECGKRVVDGDADGAR